MKLFYPLIVLFILSCNSDSGEQKKNTESELTNEHDTLLYKRDTLPNGNIIYYPNFYLVEFDSSEIELSFFDKIPETMEYGYYFTFDTTPVSSKRFILLDNGHFGILKINGRDVYVEKEGVPASEPMGEILKDVFNGNCYKINLYHEFDVNDSAKNKGTLEVSNAKYTKTFKIQRAPEHNYR